MNRWDEDGRVDLWSFSRNCDDQLNYYNSSCTYSTPPSISRQIVPSFNPQGYAFTVAGSITGGFQSGSASDARFSGPEDVCVDDESGVYDLYVADTLNNAIRLVRPDGSVSTLAGLGPDHPGYRDGPCSSASFQLPKGLDVRTIKRGGISVKLIVVADTANHRIRMIEYTPSTSHCVVRCFSGLCGNNTLSASDFHHLSPPQSGYADGDPLYSRFSAPESVAFLSDGTIAVADTGNFLIRLLLVNGTALTVAGGVVPGERDSQGNPLAGCPPPCMAGEQGFKDGNLSSARFYNPVDLTRGPNNTLWVVDENRLRVIETPHHITSLYGIQSTGRVSTIAGTSLQGNDDGVGDESTFFGAMGVFVTQDNIVHIADSTNCLIRRVTPMPLVSEPVTCSVTAVEVLRPSGCTSFDQVIDHVGKKLSRVEGNVQYNYADPYTLDKDRGKYSKNCVGNPPRDLLQKHFVLTDGDNLVVDDDRATVNEDSEQGTAITVYCPSSCLSQAKQHFGISSSASIYQHPTSSSDPAFLVEGSQWYSESSSICLSAIHSGALPPSGGYIQITFQRFDYLQSISATTALSGSSANNIVSSSLPASTTRVFSIEPFASSMFMTHSIAGHAFAALEEGCGYVDAQPATLARFNNPMGLAAKYGTSLSDSSFLYIADSGNNLIRAISATCTFICENGGRCVSHDTCSCPSGWTGKDCTRPLCSTACGTNKVCVAPNTCSCKPGFEGVNCDQPQCVQTCLNGGVCSAPDTCSCKPGWFDSNCTTPVCTQTCGNGGNCTAPDTCSCPTQWSGVDCRTPVCSQTCLHGSLCVAPDTCACTPQWTGYDCSLPVCTQGYFVSNPTSHLHVKPSAKLSFPMYKYCDMVNWCNMTKEFECDQLSLTSTIIEVPWGPAHRYRTGRKVQTTQCLLMELPIDYKLPWEVINADNSTSGFRRYMNPSPYQSDPRNSWRGYTSPTPDRAFPWIYRADRQVVQVNWLNVSQGVYVCANGGNCTAPDVCECAPGWIGFDCRTPVCEQGYYHPNQETFVSGLESTTELQIFRRFMDPRSYKLNWPYSNPTYTIDFESYLGVGTVQRLTETFPGIRYLGPERGNRISTNQGGYRCSIRAMTPWENLTFIFSHPNYYSRYMDSKVEADLNVYTHWRNMSWPATHHKSRILDQTFSGFKFKRVSGESAYFKDNITYIFTNEGYRRWGTWNSTTNPWAYGVCMMEFDRVCPSDPSKEFDLQSEQLSVLVQDTDLSFRSRLVFNDRTILNTRSRWITMGGECVNQVVRGCYNNGTCVAPNTCQCAPGWSGYNCNTPVCQQTCHHNGNCTFPNQCTCEKGWSGDNCTIPICAQECQNGGVCIAPDTCKCSQWPNAFVDGRTYGGRPSFQDPHGDALPTGWTGFDCSVPICVQSEKFILNVPNTTTKADSLVTNPNYVELTGRGGDGALTCKNPATNLSLPRCPNYDLKVTSNDGYSFQTGCGFDPFDTGCCIDHFDEPSTLKCYKCDLGIIQVSENSFFCAGEPKEYITNKDARDQPFFQKYFIEPVTMSFKKCGQYHSPRWHKPYITPINYGIAQYYEDLDPKFSSYNFKSNYTSNRFLCGVLTWEQGDYLDDAGLGLAKGVGSIYGLTKGRHQRINDANMIFNPNTGTWSQGVLRPGEGLYSCYNQGSCLGPDVCSCADGYTGYDCSVPICRHLWPDGSVKGCLNGGICHKKDNCDCVQTLSVSYQVHPEAVRGITGWTGSDCSMPMCVQGYFDPFCTDMSAAPGGEGCFRCANGGNCTAPDVCTCAPGWTGFDCRTPVCTAVADPLTRVQLGTAYEDKVISFENDPCGVTAIYGRRGWHGTKYARGNCTQPNQCTCLCKVPYIAKDCTKNGKHCQGPWQDPLFRFRNVLSKKGPEFVFGSSSCVNGYEGSVDDLDRFRTCHLTVYSPTDIERKSFGLIIGMSAFGSLVAIVYQIVGARLRKQYLLAKIERRRSKRSSEESLLKPNKGFKS